MNFLKAEWKNLALFNYEVEAKLLEKYLPAGTEIDIWNNKCYVSLVGFMFKNTKVLGFKVPFHTNFEEVNLRFYVKRFENGEWKRGVVFIKEIVPKKAITFIANTLYQEHYETQKMRHEIIENENTNTFIYQWKNKKEWNTASEANSFLNSFNGKSSTCSTPNGWVPNVNDPVLKAKQIKSKNIPCNIFKEKAPLDGKMTAKLIINNINNWQ